ncbi:glycosyltransferase [Rufibacter hautae]|uniref:Glycosyltransferase n=1 Tax=Rufibacter hautae TaxID=2595005 RepID=A0A5B6TE78_9BACT|nr:glycosyltransferase [Rufibacter hautae]KAA3437585.1 glycosyltransferase [Rufibacter hautae]
MKYWLLTTEYPPFFGGGISTYCYCTATMLQRNGHEVTVFVNDSRVKGFTEDYQKEIRIVRFNPSQTGSSSFLGHVTNISYEFAYVVKHFIEKEGKPDIIEAQEYLGTGYYLLQFKKLQYEWCNEVKILITMHSPAFLYLEYNHVPLYKYPNYWIGEMERFCIQAADVVISPSDFLVKEVGKRLTYLHKNIYVVPNPFISLEEEEVVEGVAEGEEIIFYGKLSAQKGTFKLLQYFEELWLDGFKEKLTLIGGEDIVYHPEGKTMGTIVRGKYSEYLNNGLLRLEGPIPPSKVASRLRRAKVVIVPSTVDNLPYVVLEMMSLGLIILVSKQGGQAEAITNGFDGFEFDHLEPKSFHAQLNRILNLTVDQRAFIRQNALNSVRNRYNLEVVYKQKLKVIQNELAAQGTSKSFPFIRQPADCTYPQILQKGVNGMLSIVVPYYNMGKYIEETIDSIKKSDLTSKEIIIVNDGSTDPESLRKLIPYRTDPDIKVVDVPNAGLASARNIGAESATGEFLAFLDADDQVATDYFSKATKVLGTYDNVHFVGAWTQYYEGSNKVWPTFTPEPPLVLFHNLINSSGLIFKRATFLYAGKNDKEMPFPGLEDYESVISLVENGFNGVVIPEKLFLYRVRKDSMIRGVSNVKKQVLCDYISHKHRKVYAAYGSELFSLTNANGTGTVLDNPSLDYQSFQRFPFNNPVTREVISLIKKNRVLKKIALRAFSKFIK